MKQDFSVPRFGVPPTFKLYCPTEYPTAFVGGVATIEIHLVLSLQRNTQAFVPLTSPSQESKRLRFLRESVNR